MRIPTSILFYLLSISLVSANTHAASPPHRRHLARSPIAGRYAANVERAGGPISNETSDAISSAEAAWSSEHPSAAATNVVAVSSAAGESGAAGDIITPSTASSAQSTVAAVTSEVAESAVASPSPTQEEVVVASSAAPAPVISSAAVASSIVNNAPETILVSSAAAGLTSTVVRKPQSVTTATRTASSTSTASAAAAKEEETKKIGGLSMTAFIAIIVVASVVGLGALIVFGVRKWKLRPSNRFDKRMKPIDFSPHNDGMNDDFLEKTLQRSGSRSSADVQRQQFVRDLETDPNYVAGVPDHDFTANANHAGYGAYEDKYDANNATYHHDPFAHAQSYEYDDGYYGNNAHGYPPAAAGAHHVDYPSHDYPTQDQPSEGYADLQRGNSNGSDHAPRQQAYPTAFPSPDDYLGRPTGGADGPYAQAAQYRGY